MMVLRSGVVVGGIKEELELERGGLIGISSPSREVLAQALIIMVAQMGSARRWVQLKPIATPPSSNSVSCNAKKGKSLPLRTWTKNTKMGVPFLPNEFLVFFF